MVRGCPVAPPALAPPPLSVPPALASAAPWPSPFPPAAARAAAGCSKLVVRSAATASVSYWNSPVEGRSEEHTSELQSRFDIVCRLLLENKKKKEKYIIYIQHLIYRV